MLAVMSGLDVDGRRLDQGLLYVCDEAALSTRELQVG